jgi:succinyl-diaminopimelate desuccinylase
VNAILAASRLASIFDERDRELRGTSHPLVGHASLTVTRIAGGIADNVVPDDCEMVLDRRLLPGETLDAALDDLQALLTRAKRDHDVDVIRTNAGSAETALDDPLVRKAVAISRTHGVTFPQPGGLTGGCDLVHFDDVGAVGIVLGPRSLDVAHQPDEYIPKDDLARAALIYRDIAVGDDAALICAMPHDRISKMASISTMMPLGSEPMPTAERAWRPASPSVSTKRSEQPLMTLG